MSQNWYYTNGKATNGPVTVVELKELVRSKQLTPTHMVRREDQDKWHPASKLKGLFDTPVPTAEVVESSVSEFPPSQLAPPVETRPALAGQTSLKKRWGKLSGKQKAGVIGSGFFVLLLIGAVADQVKNSNSVLTAEYFPHKPGMERSFTRKTNNIAKNDGTSIDTRWRMIHKQDGTIETIGPPPVNATESVKYRQADGYVELGLRDGTWEPVLKIGAKPGEGWERNGRTYSFKEFTKFDGMQCAVVLEKSVYQGLKKETLNWYAKGEGLVKQEDRAEADGEMKLLAVMVMETGKPGDGSKGTNEGQESSKTEKGGFVKGNPGKNTRQQFVNAVLGFKADTPLTTQNISGRQYSIYGGGGARNMKEYTTTFGPADPENYFDGEAAKMSGGRVVRWRHRCSDGQITVEAELFQGPDGPWVQIRRFGLF